MQLKKETIRRFADLTAKIRPNTIMQVLGYILYESKDNVQTLTKTNLSSYCRYTVGFDTMPDVSVLLEEKVLNSLAANEDPNTLTKGVIDFIVKGNKVLLTDGKFKQSFEPMAVDLYPIFPEHDDNTLRIEMPREMTLSIAIAATYADEKHKTNYSYVHINNDVFATSNLSMYRKSFDVPINIILSKESSQIIGALQSCFYHSIGNMDFFYSDPGLLYVFVKPEIASPDYMGLIDRLDTSSKMTVSKKDIEQFCHMTRAIHDTNDTPVCTIECTDEKVALNYEHAGLNKSNWVEIEAQNMYEFDPVRFDPKTASDALRVLPYDKVNISISNNNILITCDDDPYYMGVIMGLTLQTI